MGKHKAFILLGAAVVIALVVSFLVYGFLQRRGSVRQVAPLQTQPIAVAVVDISWGTSLKKEMLKIEPFLKGSVPDGYFSDPAPLTGRISITNIKAKEPILESKLAPATLKTGGVAAIIRSKKRAVAVKVDKFIGVSGFIHPGNRVDVLVTLTSAKTSTSITKTVLENILVLAAGPEVEKTSKEEKAQPVEVITLEVTPEEAEKLALAATEGKLQLALRNFSDTEDVLTRGTTIPALLGSYSGQPAPKAVRAGSMTSFFAVQLIKGGKVSELKFEKE